MQFVRNLINQGLPNYDLKQSNSFTCVYCSNIIYLVFDEQYDYPTLVVKVSSLNNFKQLFEHTQQLHARLPSIIAEPLFADTINDLNVYIEKGLPGSPWFKIVDGKHGKERTRELALNSLLRFQRAVADNNNWLAIVNIKAELLNVWQLYLASDIKSIESKNTEMEKLITPAEQFNTINSQYQHGDFCINNLIYSNNAAAIVDFEEFGHSCMPLHDEFSLSISFFSREKTFNINTLKEEIDACISTKRKELNLTEQQLKCLFLHFLLEKITNNYSREIRAKYVNLLITTLTIFIDNHNVLFAK